MSEQYVPTAEELQGNSWMHCFAQTGPFPFEAVTSSGTLPESLHQSEHEEPTRL